MLRVEVPGPSACHNRARYLHLLLYPSGLSGPLGVFKTSCPTLHPLPIVEPLASGAVVSRQLA
jgi:hypothetical protein